MSAFVDRKYLLMVSVKLENFKAKKEFLWNCRCPFCGDSKKNKAKSRGYFYKKKSNLFFMCHNCLESISLGTFLKRMDPLLHQEYQLENYKESNGGVFTKEPDFSFFKSQPVITKPEVTKLNIPTVASLPDGHPGKDYLLKRKLPQEAFSRLYYTDNFLDWAKDIFTIEKDVPSDARIVIPFLDQNGALMGVQGRAINQTKIRYISLKKNEDFKKIYGLEKINLDQTIYVFEGPFDSLFIPNSLATMDSSLGAVKEIVGEYDYVLVFDNQPRNKQICKEINRCITNRMKVVLFPENIEGKDINEMILSGMSQKEIFELIKKHTFQGLKAQLQFTNWKRI